MKLNELLKSPPSENYLKNSSRLTYGLFIIAGLLYSFDYKYGAMIALVLILIVMFGQKMMLNQINKDFAEMYYAKKMYEETQNLDYLYFIDLRSQQILQDNKVLSDKAKNEIMALRAYVEPILMKSEIE
ncbi:hypothetical protein EDC44_12111 [Cricetibacter osteomyelitidis]|uniref:Methyl-accepting chemotaxis protein n=1 Tax=Cricetibacter osteomyelitidis TaxID=1521931 RepID=A0A4R2SV13_9PAST|nr:hypothetical protein [Cricetibacter osteomyelitidis]TCP93300.1 hypothetical protein EDC44_12111 [Cricetibacter osteomyelitidis]